MMGWRSDPGLRRIDAAGVAICVAIGACVYLLGIAPLRSVHETAVDLGSQVAAAEQELAAARARAAELESDLSDIQTELENAPVRLEPLSSLNDRLRMLASYADEHGLRVDEIRPGEVHAAGAFGLVPISISGVGSYADCAGFLATVRARLADTAVSAFRLRADSLASPDEPRFEFDLAWFADEAN